MLQDGGMIWLQRTAIIWDAIPTIFLIIEVIFFCATKRFDIFPALKVIPFSWELK